MSSDVIEVVEGPTPVVSVIAAVVEVVTIELAKGDPGADSTVPGPPGDPGADSTVPGPPGDPGTPGVVQSVKAGSNITVDDDDPANPVVNGSPSGVQSVKPGTNITVDDSDAANPTINGVPAGPWDDVAGGINYPGGKVGIGGMPTEYLDILGALALNIRMGYAAAPGSYANFIRNAFSGTPGNHTMTFVLRQNGTEHTMMTLRADGRILFGGSPVFGGDVGINIGIAIPPASLYVGSKSSDGYGNIEIFSFGLGGDKNYRAGFRMTVVGGNESANTYTFHVNTGIGGGTTRDVYTVRGDGLMVFPAAAGPVLTDPNGGLWKLKVDTSGNLTTESVT